MRFGGKELPVLTLPPDWSARISAIARHETIIAEALSGREDRRQRQARLLWSLAYTAISTTARETGYMRGVLLAAREMPVAVPFWPQSVLLRAEAAEAMATLEIGPTEGLSVFRVDGYALVMAHAMQWEVVRIASVQAESLSLTADLEATWPAGTMVVPLLAGHLPRPDTAHETDEFGRWNIDFEEEFLKLDN